MHPLIDVWLLVDVLENAGMLGHDPRSLSKNSSGSHVHTFLIETSVSNSGLHIEGIWGQ